MAPLADTVRPKDLSEVVGQEHLLSDGSLFRKMTDNGKVPNMVFYGPSGTGKTTVARIIAEKSGMTLGELADRLPPFSVITRLIFTERDKMSSVISALREDCGNARCAGFDFGDGRVNIYASASGRFRLIAEATDSETAEEITLRAIDMLEKR